MHMRDSMEMRPEPNMEPVFERRLAFMRPTLPPLDRVMALYAPAYASGIVTNANVVTRFEDAAAERLAQFGNGCRERAFDHIHARPHRVQQFVLGHHFARMAQEFQHDFERLSF